MNKPINGCLFMLNGLVHANPEGFDTIIEPVMNYLKECLKVTGDKDLTCRLAIGLVNDIAHTIE